MGCPIDAHGLVRCQGACSERLQSVANLKIAAASHIHLT